MKKSYDYRHRNQETKWNVPEIPSAEKAFRIICWIRSGVTGGLVVRAVGYEGVDEEAASATAW